MSDSVPESVSHWIVLLKQGDNRAPEEIWQRVFQRTVELARNHLRILTRRAAADEEDVAISAIHSFFRGVKDGRFPRLSDRNDLWKLLLVITARKANALKRKLLAAKRRETLHMGPDIESEDAWQWLQQSFSAAPCAEDAAILAEEVQQRLDALPDDVYRQIAVEKLQGYTNKEIADRLGTYEVKIERKLRAIRCLWRDDRQSDG